MDMVCQADDQIQIDFTKDPIIPRIDGKYLQATHTSLGADDGMGIATCFAILADKTVKHGPLEVLVTRDEETGLYGASDLEPGVLKAKTLINVDNEDEGACTQVALFSKEYSSLPSTSTPWYLSLLFIFVAADSRYITGLTPAVDPNTNYDELLMVWARSYILSGGLAECERRGAITRRDKSTIVDHEFLYPLYCEKDPMWKVLYTWMDVRAAPPPDG